MSIPISASVRPKVLLLPRPRESILADLRSRFLQTSTPCFKSGRKAKLPAPLPLKNVGCHYPHSAIGQKFTKMPDYCKYAFLQKGVLSCKQIHLSIILLLYPVRQKKSISKNHFFAIRRTITAYLKPLPKSTPSCKKF